MWLVAVIGSARWHYLADRTGHPQRCDGPWISSASRMALARCSPRDNALSCHSWLLGLISGLSAGAIMSLPSRILLPATRAIGMGLFFTVFYALQLLAPIIGGRIAKATGSAAAAFDFGAALLVICGAALAGCQIVARRQTTALVASR